MMRLVIASMLAGLVAPGAVAQPAAPPEPILRVTVEPQEGVVGQPTTLRIEVLAPNYMTAPPALPDFQVRNAVTRPLGTLNLSEQHDGTTFAGVRFAFAVYPQEPGRYAIAGQDVTIRYAAEPPQTREARLSLPDIAFQAIIPDEATSLDPFVSASGLDIEQTVRRSSDELKVGDAVTRTVTVKAAGAPAMLLPPVTFSPVAGATLYSGQPSLQDRTDPRTDALSSMRIDEATYMLEKPGDVSLPAIDIAWWNAHAQRIEHTRADAVAFHVRDNPAALHSASDERADRWTWSGFVDLVLRHWPLAVLALAAAITVAWASPRIVRTITAWYHRRRDAYRRSEAWSYRQMTACARRGDARAFYFAMLDWLGRFDPIAPDHTIRGLRAAAQDAVLDHQIDDLERRLFAAPSVAAEATHWSPHTLLRHLGAARRHLLARASHDRTTAKGELNPVTTNSSARHRLRPVAR